MILDVGCDNRKIIGAIGIDIKKNSQADIICDLEQGIPFKDNSFDKIISNHVMEYFCNSYKFLNEIYRVSKDRTEVIIRVPHFSGTAAWEGLGHRKTFGVNTRFDEMDNKFKILDKKIHYFTYLDRERCLRNKILSKIIDTISNKFINFANRILCHWIGGYQEIYWKLEVNKGD